MQRKRLPATNFFNETGALQVFLRAAPLLESFNFEWNDGDDVMLKRRTKEKRVGA